MNRDPLTMPKKQYDIDLLCFLKTLDLETFTVTDITTHLLSHYEDRFEKKKNATQYVYRRLKQYVNEGILIALPGESGKAIVFTWKNTITLEASSLQRHNEHAPAAHFNDKITKLRAKIKFCEAEMLAHLGEAEAYNEWAEEMPELANDVKQFHQYTREKSKLMLGKVKGFERLLAYYEARQS